MKARELSNLYKQLEIFREEQGIPKEYQRNQRNQRNLMNGLTISTELRVLF